MPYNVFIHAVSLTLNRVLFSNVFRTAIHFSTVAENETTSLQIKLKYTYNFVLIHHDWLGHNYALNDHFCILSRADSGEWSNHLRLQFTSVVVNIPILLHRSMSLLFSLDIFGSRNKEWILRVNLRLKNAYRVWIIVSLMSIHCQNSISCVSWIRWQDCIFIF